jgi:secondary thiamine-phosphate synthase enzyme
MIHTKSIQVKTNGEGLYEITDKAKNVLRESKIEEGLLTVFIQHTSASLTIQENADPSAKRDLEYFLKKLVPQNDPGFTHTFEGPDDMPSHIKSALTQTSISIPVINGEMALGTWQGIYLWEHRRMAHNRRLIVQVMGN